VNLQGHYKKNAVQVSYLVVPPNREKKILTNSIENWTLPCMQNSTKIATTSVAGINGMPPNKFFLFI
jgi:hypothetical protein